MVIMFQGVFVGEAIMKHFSVML